MDPTARRVSDPRAQFPAQHSLQHQRRTAAISAIRIGTRGSTIDPAERILGRLDAQLEYAEISEILTEGIANYL